MSRLWNWIVEEKGFISPKIGYCELEGKGNGVLCLEEIKKGETLMFLPLNALVNRQTIPITSRECSTQGLIARYLATCKKSFVQGLPPPESFDCIPLTWTDAEIAELPQVYRDQIQEQRETLRQDFEQSKVSDFARYRWAWLCVNTRVIYWSLFEMTLAPGLDLFNHSFEEGTVKVDVNPRRGATVYAERDYKPKEEICLRYGPHDNGFLLCEYGFVLPPNQNPYDYIDITPEIEDLLDEAMKETLDDEGLLGDYTLDKDGDASYRTELALAGLEGSERKWEKFRLGYTSGLEYRKFIDETLEKIKLRLIEDYKIRSTTCSRPQTRQLYKNYLEILESSMF